MLGNSILNKLPPTKYRPAGLLKIMVFPNIEGGTDPPPPPDAVYTNVEGRSSA